MKQVLSINAFGAFLLVVALSGCKTKSEVRREQDVERLKMELRDVKTDRADIDGLSQELKVEISRMSNLVEERAVQQNRQLEDIRKELASLNNRITTIEQRAVAEENAEKQRVAEKAKASFDLGKRYYDEGRYSEAVEVLKVVSRNKARTDEGKKAQFYLGESHFSNKEFASAVLEFSEFKKMYPKDPLVPQAIYRQANSFRSLGKSKEAKLFYQELVDRFPKNGLAAKAKQEMRKLK